MKTHFIYFFFVLILIPLISNAQSNYEDVVYLKNGSIIHGMIIEQVPNKTIKIKTYDGNVFVYTIDEIEKLTKEIPENDTNSAKSNDTSTFKPTPNLAFKKGDVSLSFHVGYISEPFTLGSSAITGGEPWGLHLTYATSDHIAIGMEIGDLASSTKGSYTYPSSNGYLDIVSYSIPFTTIYYLADIQLHWAIRSKHSFYFGLAGGLSVLSSYEIRGTSFNEPAPSVGGLIYQLTAIGWRTIGKHFGINFELGYGIKGIINGGLDYRF